MPGILHTHLWGADNSSCLSWKRPLGPLSLAGVSSCSQGWEVLLSLTPPVKDFGAGNEVAYDALRCLENN